MIALTALPIIVMAIVSATIIAIGIATKPKAASETQREIDRQSIDIINQKIAILEQKVDQQPRYVTRYTPKRTGKKRSDWFPRTTYRVSR